MLHDVWLEPDYGISNDELRDVSGDMEDIREEAMEKLSDMEYYAVLQDYHKFKEIYLQEMRTKFNP